VGGSGIKPSDVFKLLNQVGREPESIIISLIAFIEGLKAEWY
jgi:hypothetical protein